MSHTFYIYHTPLGALSLEADDLGLTRIAFGKTQLRGEFKPSTYTNNAATQIQEYLAKKRNVFSIPIHPEGSPFQTHVWKTLENIPYGETRSYKDIATLIGNVDSYRAVGSAINKNPLPIVIPSHRAVNSSGKVSANTDRTKSFLLDLERSDDHQSS